MFRFPMKFYLWSALAIAICSIASSGLILVFGTSHWGPLDPPETNYMEHLSSVSDFSVAVSSIFTLMVGAIAIIAVIVAERAEIKSIERLKVDISSLWSCLNTIRTRSILYTTPNQIDISLDLFQHEREVIQNILSSPTGFSLYIWQIKHKKRGLDKISADLATLINWSTLKFEDNPAEILNAMAIRANNLSRTLSEVNDDDIAEMASILQKISLGLDLAKNEMKNDILTDFLVDFDQTRTNTYKCPSIEDVKKYAEIAQMKIGGKAGESVIYFGERAINGDASDWKTWHGLLRQLKLNDT